MKVRVTMTIDLVVNGKTYKDWTDETPNEDNIISSIEDEFTTNVEFEVSRVLAEELNWARLDKPRRAGDTYGIATTAKRKGGKR